MPLDWSLHSDLPQGFTLGTPTAWDVAFRDSPTFDADLAAVGQHSPELAAFFKQSFDSDAQVRFIAADSRSIATGFTANVQVISSDLGPVGVAPGLKDLADAKVKLLSTQNTVVQPVERAGNHLAGQQAVRLDYALTGPPGAPQVRSYLTVVERSGRRYEYELTMGARPDAAGTTFATLSNLFTLFRPSGATPSPVPSR